MTSPLPQQPRKKTTGGARKVEVVGSGVAGGVGSVFGAAKLRDEFLKDPKVKPEHKAAFKRATVHGGRAAMRAGVKPEKVAHVVRAVESGHPGFKPLAVAVTAGTLATTAHRGQELQRAFERRAKTREWSGGKSAPRHTGPKVRVAVVYHAPKHAVKPYAGKRRVPTVVDRLKANVKTTAMIHGPRVYRVLEEGVEMLKAACCTGDMTGVPRSAFLKGIGKVHVVGYHGDGKFHVIDSSDSGRVVHRDNLNFHRKKKGSTVAKDAFGVEHVEKAGPLSGVKGAAKFTQSLQGAEFKSYQGGLKTTGMKQDLGLGATRGGAHRATGRHRPPASRGKTAVKVAGVASVPVAGAAVAGRKKDPVGKSAFGVEHVEKALTGTPGDKRNTKYAASALAGGNVANVLAGSRTRNRAAVVGSIGAAGGAALYHRHRNSVDGAKGIYASRKAAAARRGDPAEAKKIRSAPVAKSAFGVGHVEKALTGTRGDKRNTKAVAATYGGAGVGAAAGRQVAARSAGTTVGDVKRLASSVVPEHMANAMANSAGKTPKATSTAGMFREGFKEGRSEIKTATKVVRDTVPGAARVMRGSRVGGIAGAAGGAAAFAAARHHKKS